MADTSSGWGRASGSGAGAGRPVVSDVSGDVRVGPAFSGERDVLPGGEQDGVRRVGHLPHASRLLRGRIDDGSGGNPEWRSGGSGDAHRRTAGVHNVVHGVDVPGRPGGRVLAGSTASDPLADVVADAYADGDVLADGNSDNGALSKSDGNGKSDVYRLPVGRRVKLAVRAVVVAVLVSGGIVTCAYVAVGRAAAVLLDRTLPIGYTDTLWVVGGVAAVAGVLAFLLSGAGGPRRRRSGGGAASSLGDDVRRWPGPVRAGGAGGGPSVSENVQRLQQRGRG